jgi:hypothetical protein
MNLDMEKVIQSIRNIVIYYFEIFVGILVSPSSTFKALLEPQGKKFKITKTDKLDERPFFFVAISLTLGIIIASSLSIKNAPPEVTSQILTSTVIPYLFLWLLYGIVFHFSAKALGGKGKLSQSISGLFYVLGTLHPLLLLFVYLLSAVFPDSVSYNLTLRNPTLYTGVFVIPDYLKVNILGFNIRALYYTVSLIITSIYLYFPLSIIHKLSLGKVILLYLIGTIGIAGCSFAGLILDSLSMVGL